MQRGDEIFRYAAEPESARGDRHVVVQQAVERSLGVRVNFAHAERLTTDYTNASEMAGCRAANYRQIAGSNFMTTLAHQLANYACSLKFEDLSKNVVHEVKRRVIDSLGCALGAWNEEPCEIARKVVSDFSAKNGATVDRHFAQGAAGLGRVRERLLHSLFRLQRHLSFERAGASER